MNHRHLHTCNSSWFYLALFGWSNERDEAKKFLSSVIWSHNHGLLILVRIIDLVETLCLPCVLCILVCSDITVMVSACTKFMRVLTSNLFFAKGICLPEQELISWFGEVASSIGKSPVCTILPLVVQSKELFKRWQKQCLACQRIWLL